MNSKYNLKNTPFFARFNVQFTKLNVNENAKAIQCHLCEYWVHIECDHLIILISNTFKVLGFMLPVVVLSFHLHL